MDNIWKQCELRESRMRRRECECSTKIKRDTNKKSHMPTAVKKGFVKPKWKRQVFHWDSYTDRILTTDQTLKCMYPIERE